MSNYGLVGEYMVAIGDGVYEVQEWDYSEVERKRTIYVYDNDKMITDDNHDFGDGFTLKDFIDIYDAMVERKR